MKVSELVLEFITEIDRCVSLASKNPYQYAIVHENIRCAVANCFPYCVYFRVEKDSIAVLAVFHTSRNPAVWQSRT
jgi:plasmid stabilization system protein ParE